MQIRFSISKNVSNNHFLFKLLSERKEKKMEHLKKRKSSRLTAILLSLMMVVVFIPTFAFAANNTITVYMTVSNAGQLAKANDGSAMANKEVTVTDVDGDGHFTFHEALVAVHKAYNSEDGYSGSTSSYGYSVTKVWGVENGGSYLFFVNDEGISTGVDGATVNNGDYLTASVMSDTTYYADWYSAFDAKTKTAKTGSAVSLTLKGHLGMAYEPEDMKYVALQGITVKDTNGTEYGKTDANGKVNLTFSKEGTYIITAEGAVKDATVSVYSIPGGQTTDGKYYVTDSSMNYLYTDKDYGIGPYPPNEIKKMSMDDFLDLEEDEVAAMHLVYASKYVNQYEAYYPIKIDVPIIAPACVITVTKAEAPKPSTPKTSIAKATVTAKTVTYTGKALKPAVTVKLSGKTLKSGTDYTVAYSKNVNAGKAKVTVTGKGNYTGTAAGTFTIAKAAQPLKVTGKTVKIKKKTIKKKAKKLDVSKVLAVSGAKGKVTYTKVKGNKKIKISETTGKVTVKKKLKKGTYKVKVKVSAAGNANYKAGSKTVTFTIKIKKK